MHSMADLTSLIKQKYTVDEVMAEVIDDYDVKEFLKKYEDYIDDDMMKTGRSTLREFVLFKNDPHYKYELSLINSQFAISVVPRNTPLQQKYRDKVPSKLFYDNSTRKYKGVQMTDYQMDMSNATAYGLVNSFVERYRYGDNSKGMWLMGSFGIGKTYLMGAMATELNKRQVGVNFVNAAQLMNDMYEVIRSNSSDDSVQKQIGYLQKSEVLIIDDLGTEKMTRNNVVDILYSIIKYRGEHNKPTFITSNLTKDQYYKALYDTKAIERKDIARLKEQIDVLTKEVQMIGPNRRDKA